MNQPDEETRREIIRLGKERYEKDVRATVEADPRNKGKMLAIDVRTSQYEVGDDILIAVEALKARLPDAEPFAVKIGYPTAARFGYLQVKR